MAEDTGIGKLIDQMKLQNSHLSEMKDSVKSTQESQYETERHTRNTRRHLLEMKKMQLVMNDFQARTVYGFENFADMIDANKLQELENEGERKSIFEDIRDAIRRVGTNTDSAEQQAATSSAVGDALGGMGKMLGGVGIGIGAAGIGIAAVIGAGSYLIQTLEDMDAQKIADNVGILVNMGKEHENFLLDGGSVAIALTGLGIGLAAFGVGSGVAGAVDMFLQEGWAEKIKNNVLTLLSIADSGGGNLAVLGDSGTLFLAMTGLGLGLLAFGIGSGVAGGIDKFLEDDWPERIKHNVGVLLSIAELNTPDAEPVRVALKKLSGGLMAFGIGSFFAKGSHEGQGEQIRETVGHLLSIAEDPNADVESISIATAALGALGSGLFAFGIGSFFAKAVGEGSGAKVRKEVADLLEIANDPNTSLENITKATTALGALGTGLTAFGAGNFVQSLAAAGAAVLDFFSGNKSPIEQAKDLGDNAEKIERGVEALTGFNESLIGFQNVKNFKFDAETFAGDLAVATETLEAALIGGTIGGGWWDGPEFNFKGLKNYQDDVDDLADALVRLQQGFGGALNAMSGENAMLTVAAGAGGSGGNTVIAPSTSTNSGGNQVNIVQHHGESKGKNSVQQSRDT